MAAREHVAVKATANGRDPTNRGGFPGKPCSLDLIQEMCTVTGRRPPLGQHC